MQLTREPLRPTTAFLEAALDYAARGWCVLPLYPVADGLCACSEGKGCGSPGKHPLAALVPHGLSQATTDERRIRDWWTRRPNADIGIRTGRESNLVVL